MFHAPANTTVPLIFFFFFFSQILKKNLRSSLVLETDGAKAPSLFVFLAKNGSDGAAQLGLLRYFRLPNRESEQRQEMLHGQKFEIRSNLPLLTRRGAWPVFLPSCTRSGKNNCEMVPTKLEHVTDTSKSPLAIISGLGTTLEQKGSTFGTRSTWNSGRVERAVPCPLSELSLSRHFRPGFFLLVASFQDFFSLLLSLCLHFSGGILMLAHMLT